MYGSCKYHGVVEVFKVVSGDGSERYICEECGNYVNHSTVSFSKKLVEEG